ncbi:[NiFe]-hydrogenase assembly chaperone HybE [Zavarzinia compransoris]|uniref:[NiFe]-hydrogenase assembly, chaperone, HybE n=1 Tax=Zavarzinia compransoris TaxID=1264899 RepID=A0A317E8U2_9PROT|nr:[NiFe]-hydrogenase assembly chaperone HybE [Zavarzinia compransoris]PWR23151.1 [NiFe]-hydrogenase assembly, chaperone, HybE [Zavarzinia compransoris]TDP46292.1 [NiFe] hydrogenase assembly HybE family chaperone [Zavarzinia compransoris]
MAARRFEGSFLGDASRLSPGARMECKICWHVYDPAEGCSVWQVPAGTPFAALPAEWRCPNCDGEREQFMLLHDEAAPETAPDPVAVRAAALEDMFRAVAARDMAGIPVVNDKLAVRAVGFQPWQDLALGVLVTPWFMNLILLPLDPAVDAPVVGSKRLVDFPSGRYEFVQGFDNRLGPWEGCSLFSPMFEFRTQAEAVEVADAVMTALFDPEIREGGAPTAEIRQRREADLAAIAEAEAQVQVPVQADSVPAGPASRRALLFGTGEA